MTTFRDLYDDPIHDPFKGNYRKIMERFTIPTTASGQTWEAKEVYYKTFFVDITCANAYVGLFEDTKHVTGTTRLLHAPTHCPTSFENEADCEFGSVALLDDVMNGNVQVVSYNDTMFEATEEFSIHDTVQTTLEKWKEDTKKTVLSPVNTKAPKQTIRVPKLMYVPPKYINLFLGKRLTPRQLMEEVYQSWRRTKTATSNLSSVG
jgi:hypothetical protein